MKIGEVLRYPQRKLVKSALDRTGCVPAEIDGLRNFFALTLAPDKPLCGLERGINPIGTVKGPDGQRTPAVLISSSPHKAGTEITPWQDHFRPDVGLARYFGDSKPESSQPPEKVAGNKALLHQFQLHSSPDPSERALAAPLVLFLAVPHQGRTKGQRRFQGIAVLRAAERVVQRQARQQAFTNYRYDLLILDLSAENEYFSWDWINARRNPSLSAAESLQMAPRAWRTWAKKGEAALPSLRRRVAKLKTVGRAEQLPTAGSKDEETLQYIYEYFLTRKHSFEALAERVVEHTIRQSGTRYVRGWITSASGDGGADFVGRVDLGEEGPLAQARLVLLGQAKCVAPSSSTSAELLARVVARLRRGWIGAFVTTGHFSLAAQREVIEDRYPLILINGREVARAVRRIMYLEGTHDLARFLERVESSYKERIRTRLAEEILED